MDIWGIKPDPYNPRTRGAEICSRVRWRQWEYLYELIYIYPHLSLSRFTKIIEPLYE